ncbi:MAG: hypothetical protein J6J13_00780 [Clostridia bacterium]|nr:hypothetical protein [Clostridia bacterium]
MAVGKIEGSVDFFEELATDNRGLVQKFIDIIKDLISRIDLVSRNRTIREDLEYIEQRLMRVYRSRDSKKAAEKAPHEQYMSRRLTNNDLDEYLSAGNRKNKNKIAAVNAGKKVILTSKQEITDFINDSIEKKAGDTTVAYGKVNDRLADAVFRESNGKIKIKDNYLELIPTDLQHAYEEHSKAKQEGDIDLERSDFENIPEYLDSFTEVLYAIEYSSGNVKVCISKQLPNGRVLIIETVSKSRGSLQFKNAIGVSENKYQEEYIGKYKKRVETTTRGNESSNNSLRDASNSNNSIPENELTVNTNISEETENYTEGIEMSNGEFSSGSPMQRARDNSVDKYGLKQDNVSRANKPGELINEYYYALDKGEWKLFYNAIAKSGYLATANVGVVAPIVVNNKLIIAERKYAGKDAHDYVVIDAFQIQELYDGDLLDFVKKLFDTGDLIYDRQTMYQNLSRILKRNQSPGVLTRFDADSQRYVIGSSAKIVGNGSQEIHRDSQEGVAGERVSFRDKQSVQRNNELLNIKKGQYSSGSPMQRARDQSSTHLGEDLKDTPDHLKPASEREWSAFVRSFANQTNGLKDGQEKSIIIITAESHYFVNADGYMRGNILVKTSIDNYNEGVEFYGSVSITKNIDYANEEYGNRPGDNSISSDSFENGQRDSGTAGLDGFDENSPDAPRYTVKSKDTRRKEIRETWEKLSNDIKNKNGQYSSGSPMQKASENLARYENGEISREEYLEENDKLYGEAIEKYGAFEQGENAKSPISVPQKVADNKPTERFVRTVIETGRLTNDMVESIEVEILTGGFSYEVVSDETAIKKANAAIENGTAEDRWQEVVNGRSINKNDIAIGEQLLSEAIKLGDSKRVLELSAELADIFTRAGQAVQSARLLKKMTGAGRVVAAQRYVQTLNKDLRQKYGDDMPPIKISVEAAQVILKLSNYN